MAIATYTDLQTSIANFLARSDLTAQIPDFIALAEATMSRELETRSQEKRATANTVSGNEYLSLPTDLREVREVKLNTAPLTVLRYYSPVALDEQYASEGGGKPKGYNISHPQCAREMQKIRQEMNKKKRKTSRQLNRNGLLKQINTLLELGEN